MKKIVTLFLCCVFAFVSLAALAGCGGRGDYQGYVDESGVAHVVFMGRDVESERVNYQRVVDSFNASQSQIHVEMQWFTDGTSYNTMLDGLGTNLPDCLMLSNAMFLRYVSSGKLYDYKARITQDELELLYEDAYSYYCYDPATKQVGHSESAGLYGLPKDMGPVAICYNVDLLKTMVAEYNAANPSAPLDIDTITDPDDPMTFSQFLDVGKKLKTVLSSGQYVCSGYDMQSAVYSNNANYFTDDTAATQAIDTDNFVGAIQFVQDLYKEGILPPAGTVSSGGEALFTSGNALFYYAGPWKTKDYWAAIGFEWDLIPVLCGDADGAVSTCYVGGMAFCVSANSAVKDYAVEFLRYVALDLNAQRSLYSNGQCIPNLVELADEYRNNSENLLANQNPKNRGVWLDCVDGAGEKTVDGETVIDKVSGRYRAEAYTYDETWYTFLTDFMAGNSGSFGSFWQEKSDGTWVNVGEALRAFAPTLQESLTELRSYLV